MTTFYLLRHGIKETIRGDPPLSETGFQQAEATAKFLKKFPISAIYSSPLKRALQTARASGKELGLEVITDNRLKERINWGDKDNETFEEFIDEWEKGSRDRHYKSSHGKSSFETGEIFKEFLLEKAEKYPDKSILVATHGGAIGDLLLNNFTNLTLATSSTGAAYVEIWECSITTLELNHGKFSLKEVGNISHLSNLVPVN
jgi:broad specificity phosphatase PhoE